MGELQIVELARRLQAGEDIKEIRNIPGTVWKMEVKAWKELKEKGEQGGKEQTICSIWRRRDDEAYMRKQQNFAKII